MSGAAEVERGLVRARVRRASGLLRIGMGTGFPSAVAAGVSRVLRIPATRAIKGIDRPVAEASST